MENLEIRFYNANSVIDEEEPAWIFKGLDSFDFTELEDEEQYCFE